MARSYPRFVYAKPSNAKSQGPFIIHLLQPRVVFKVCSDKEFEQPSVKDGAFSHDIDAGVIFLDDPKDFDSDEIDRLSGDALDWLVSQVKLRTITL